MQERRIPPPASLEGTAGVAKTKGPSPKGQVLAGASLLFWAVREMLRTEMKDINRVLIQSHLMMSMGFARWGVVEALLKSGAKPTLH